MLVTVNELPGVYAISESESSDSIGLSQRIGVLTDGNQSALARKIGARSATISEWVSGKYPPSYESLLALVAATGCDPGWLLTGRGEPFPAANPAAADGRAAAALLIAGALDTLESAADTLRAALPFASDAAQLAGIEVTLARLLAEAQTRRGKLPRADEESP